MPPKRHRRPPRQPVPEQSDYDSEALQTDTAQQHAALDHAAHNVPVRTNEELNLTVLKRHNPQVQQVLSVANFAVVYTFSSTTQAWEKTGTEGTLFICQLIPAVIHHGGETLVVERFNVMVLNRKGLDNFSSELHTSAAVEISDDFVMMEVSQGEEEEPLTYGFWIFSETGTSTESTRVVNAQIMVECAMRSEQSREAAIRAMERHGGEEQETFQQDLSERQGNHYSQEHPQAQPQAPQYQEHPQAQPQAPQYQQHQQATPQPAQYPQHQRANQPAQYQQHQQAPPQAAPYQQQQQGGPQAGYYNQHQHQQQYPQAAQHQQHGQGDQQTNTHQGAPGQQANLLSLFGKAPAPPAAAPEQLQQQYSNGNNQHYNSGHYQQSAPQAPHQGQPMNGNQYYQTPPPGSQPDRSSQRDNLLGLFGGPAASQNGQQYPSNGQGYAGNQQTQAPQPHAGPQQGYLPHGHPQQMYHQQMPQQMAQQAPQPTQAQNLLSLFR